MVEISEVIDDEEPIVETAIPPSQERLLDAQELEGLLGNLTRPTAKMQVQALITKLKKESDALKRVEASQQKAKKAEAATTDEEAPMESTTTPDEAAAPSTEAASTPTPPPPAVPPKPTPPPVVSPNVKYVPISTFAFDAGSYNSPTVTLYISENMEGVKREHVATQFTPGSFDLVVSDLNGKSYRLYKDNLAHDIDPEKSKVVVKKNRLILKLAKVKGEYGYDSWTDLVDKKKAKPKRSVDGKREKEDPSASIMNLMKEMYDSGDDQMRKMIGETMEKQRRGELGKDNGDMPGMPGM